MSAPTAAPPAAVGGAALDELAAATQRAASGTIMSGT